MALSDRLKGLRGKAEDAVVERKDQIHQAVQKAGEVADQRTGGKYHDKIEKAGGKALGLVDSLEDAGSTPAAGEPVTPTPAEPATPPRSPAPPAPTDPAAGA